MAKHPHAELIKQMVDDDTLRAECRGSTLECKVESVILHPSNDWRLVPPKPKTITIVANGKTYELPEPMRVAPENGAVYFTDDSENGVISYKYTSAEGLMTAQFKKWLKAGVCHATREAAQQWVDAMAEIRRAK